MCYFVVKIFYPIQTSFSIYAFLGNPQLLIITREINDEGSGYFCHANQKKSATQTYASTPRSAGCNISDGQAKQDIFSTLVNLSPKLESVKYTIQSMSNMGE